jgi:hypothetical protein
MSVQDIKEQISQLSVEDQLQLEAFLKAKLVTSRAGFHDRVESAHRRMDSGEAISSAQLRALLAREKPAA